MAYDKAVDSAALDANLKSVADAIRAKGGTTGNMEFPGGFISAVDAISSGIEVKTHSGTTWTGTDGIATVNCGFKPDLVVLTGYTIYPAANYYGEYQLSFCFEAALHEGQQNYNLLAAAFTGSTPTQINAGFQRSDEGFGVMLFGLDSSGAQVPKQMQITYKAVKYTA